MASKRFFVSSFTTVAQHGTYVFSHWLLDGNPVYTKADDPSINAKRVAMRVMEGGHDVPIRKIISRYTKSLAYCSVVAWLADRNYGGLYFYNPG